MFSPLDSHVVLNELGDKFAEALVRATTATRNDYDAFRKKFPNWTARFFERDSANLIHARLWANLEDEAGAIPGVELYAKEPLREISVVTPIGRTYKMRAKRHGKLDRVSSYPTLSDVAFWSGAFEDSFDGLEEIRLAVGYRWDQETGEIGAPVISYREGKSHVRWAYALEASTDEAATKPFAYRSLVAEPGLPTIDLRGVGTSDASREEQQR